MKMVGEGTLPGVKLGSQWRFRRAMIDAWLDDQMLGVIPDELHELATARLPKQMLALQSCFQPNQIVPELTAGTKTGVLDELACFAHSLGLVRDKTWFFGALMERENVMPTASGSIAFLHTLHRNPEQVVRPFMVLGRSTPGIDFDALDGKPTHLFVVLGLKYQELHLPWLGKLSQMFAEPGTTPSVLQAASPLEIFRLVTAAEHSLVSSASAEAQEA